MAEVIPGEENNLVVVCMGIRRSTSIVVDKEKPEQIESAVRKAISVAAPFFYGKSEAHGKEVEAINVSAAANSIRAKLGIGAKRKGGKVERAREARRAEQPQAVGSQGKEGKRETKKATPKPNISLDWIEILLKDAKRDDRKAQQAASRAHSNRAYLEQHLAQKGPDRTENQKNTTMAIFNSLYQIPNFRLFLSALAEQQIKQEKKDRIFPEFVELQSFLSKPGRGEKLAPEAEAGIIIAADLYIKYHIYNFVVADANYKKLRQEISQLPNAKDRLERIAKIWENAKKNSRPAKDPDVIKLMKLQIEGPLDADTLTACVLYIRRWQLENPASGKARSQDQIAAWKAPEVIVPEVEAAGAAKQPSAGQPSAQKKTPLEEFAQRNWKNLSSELYQAARMGRPAGVVTLSRNLPEGVSSLEEALSKLSRQDIARAYERAYNEYLHTDREFLEFCTIRKDYQGVVRSSVSLSPGSAPADRRLIMRAMQAYINDRAGKSDEWHGRFREDLKLLLANVMKSQRETLNVDGSEDIKTLSSIALYSWRRMNRNAAVGEWAGTLGIKPLTTTTATQAPEQPELKRRRTIRPGRLTQ